MSINSRAKGARGEREAVWLLNTIIERVIASPGEKWDERHVAVARQCIQRNQNQTAVGGDDLDGVFGLSFEIKRVEVLAIDKWWAQACKSAARYSEKPVLMYRQNSKPWRIVTEAAMQLPDAWKGTNLTFQRVTIEQDAFEVWFYQWVYYKMKAGDMPRL